jgi:hypothetical protein
MKLFIRFSLVTVMAFAALWGCSSTADTGCSGDGDCERGTVCLSGVCEAVGCAGLGDCQEGQTCVDIDGDGVKECTAIECQSDTDCETLAAELGEAMTCDLGVCVGTGGGGDKEVVDDVVEEIIPEVEEEILPQGDKLCQPCLDNSECGDEGNLCTPLPEGDYCTKLCGTNADCPSGYLCLEITSESKQCVPGLYNKCADCLIDGCADGEYCDQMNNECKAVVPSCDPCIQDDECGADGRCFAFAPGDRRCIPACGDDNSCPEKSECFTLNGQQGTEGAIACVPAGSSCCFGPDCSSLDCSAEEINKYVSPDGTACVQCTQDTHCPFDMPKCDNFACTSPGWSGATPVACGTECCECTNDTHCNDATKPSCDIQTGVCVESSGDCACVDPYPGCITVDGQVMCVECDNDSQCSEGCTCDTNQYVCVNPDGGGYCNAGVAACSGDCATTGCSDPSGLMPNLKCDIASGCCFDSGGACDNVSAFCIQEGSECKSIMDMFGMGGAGVPGMPTGGGMGGGMCSCTGTLEAGLACMMGMGDANNVCCPDGLMCLDMMQIMGLLGGTGTPPGAAEASGFCMALSL